MSDRRTGPSEIMNATINQPKSLTLFSHEVLGDLRVTDNDGVIWFAAPDVCRALEINNPRQACTRLRDSERMTVILNDGNRGRGGAQFVTVVNEPGLYRLIFTSRKKEAEIFQDWVFTEVLPAIRKSGAYTMAGATAPFDAVTLLEEKMRTMTITCKRHVDGLESLLRLRARILEGDPLAAAPRGRRAAGESFLTWLRFIGETMSASGAQCRRYSNQDLVAMGAPITPTRTSRALASLAGQAIDIGSGEFLVIVPMRTRKDRGWEFRVEKTSGVLTVVR